MRTTLYICLVAFLANARCDITNNRADHHFKQKTSCSVRLTRSNGTKFTISCFRFCFFRFAQPRCERKTCLCDPVLFPTPEPPLIQSYDLEFTRELSKPVNFQDVKDEQDELNEGNVINFEKISQELAKPIEIEKLNLPRIEERFEPFKFRI